MSNRHLQPLQAIADAVEEGRVEVVDDYAVEITETLLKSFPVEDVVHILERVHTRLFDELERREKQAQETLMQLQQQRHTLRQYLIRCSDVGRFR